LKRWWLVLVLVLLVVVWFGSGPIADRVTSDDVAFLRFDRHLHVDGETGEPVWDEVEPEASLEAQRAAEELTREQLGGKPWWPSRKRHVWNAQRYVNWGRVLEEMGKQDPGIWGRGK